MIITAHQICNADSSPAVTVRELRGSVWILVSGKYDSGEVELTREQAEELRDVLADLLAVE